MEIALLPKNGLKIKGKRTIFSVDSAEKTNSSAVIALVNNAKDIDVPEEAVIIDGPGEYEIGGIKMNANKQDGEIIYNPNIDGIDLLLGKITSFEKMQHKLKEQNIVVVNVNEKINPSFITSFATNAVIYYGEYANSIEEMIGRENVKRMNKYSTTADKLPQEVETIILE